jgi:acyl-CoA reductase-like NAD-dependent aldehyde dehydrogenase
VSSLVSDTASAAVVSVNPADPGDTVVRVDPAGEPGTERAAARARAAQPGWLRGGAAARADALDAAAAALAADAEDFAALIVREVGKPAAEARAEVARAAAIVRYYAQAPYRPSGEVHEPAAGGGLLLTRRRPHGVAGLITPWNFPLAIPLWKAAPALAIGNTLLLKPAPEATACALRLAELLAAHLPQDVFAVVPGGAREGTALIEAADVVSFTGSTAVGNAVVRAATALGTPVQAEMGGQNATLVLPEADIERAAAQIAASVAGYAGQKCTATSRVIAVGAAAGPLREALAAALRDFPVGDPAAPGTACGPLIGPAALARVTEVQRGVAAAGGTVLAGGGPLDRDGWFTAPTLVEGLPRDHVLATEEVFAPIALLSAAADLDQALAVADGVRHGLVTAVYTRDLDAALAAADRLRTGMVKVNAPTTGVDFHLPFGGSKASSHGAREQGSAALEFYTETRTVSLLPATVG